MRQLVAVPFEEIKARIKAEKGKKRTPRCFVAGALYSPLPTSILADWLG